MAGAGAAEAAHVKRLLAKVQGNDVDVLKLHHHLGPDANRAVIGAVLSALMHCESCQVLYMQNFNEGVTDAEMDLLVEVLRRGRIWCVNLGENYKVTTQRWWQFCDELAHTQVTHMYVSDHVIPAELKTSMRSVIRANRSKHGRHSDPANMAVIKRCTNMWWNPINHFKSQMRRRPTRRAGRRVLAGSSSSSAAVS